jgi:hypothetical protein
MSDRFDAAIQRFDEANSRDPRKDVVGGVEHPRELLHARRLSEWVMRLNPESSEPLRLAARCQHICRWTIPRDTYPEGRAGYLRWRKRLQEFHAETSAKILREVGYGEDVINRVRDLNLKKGLGTDPECQTLEDALCLVFLEFQLAELASRTDEETMLNAIRKTWAKMSEQGRREALALSYGPRERGFIEKALKG